MERGKDYAYGTHTLQGHGFNAVDRRKLPQTANTHGATAQTACGHSTKESESEHGALDLTTGRSTFVLMAIETIGDAFSASWRVRVRCAWGKHDGMKSVRSCVEGAELDLQTLVWTRGRDFPLARLESRLKCPRCGSRRVSLLFDVPSNSNVLRSSG